MRVDRGLNMSIDFNNEDFSFNNFTKAVDRGEVVMGVENIYKTLKYLKENKNAFNYYYLMRILWSIVMYDPRYIRDIPRYYIDENLIKQAYRSNKDTYQYMSLFSRNVYLREGVVWDCIRGMITFWRVVFAVATSNEKLGDKL